LNVFVDTLSDCIDLWFGKDEETDKYIIKEFKPLVHKAKDGELNEWIDNPWECLALVIILGKTQSITSISSII
jgi:uncharacterized protein (DUF924 family)